MPLRRWYEIMKPGMVYGNVIPYIGSFALAAGRAIDWSTFLVGFAGLALVIASGCVFNNVIDRDIDARMGRTKGRALPAGAIDPERALLFASALGVAGFALLAFRVNLAAATAALAGFFFYVVMYSLWWKRRSEWGTLVGSVAGAMPPVVGYAAGGGRSGLAAFLLFAIMVAWQMPHFFAIAIRHKDEYAAAGVPVLPVARGIRATKRQLLAYVIAFVVLAPAPALFGFAGRGYLVASLLLGLGWLALCLRGFRLEDGDPAVRAWAKRVFLMSLFVMVALFSAMALSTAA